jgi:hypothetical protein
MVKKLESKQGDKGMQATIAYVVEVICKSPDGTKEGYCVTGPYLERVQADGVRDWHRVQRRKEPKQYANVIAIRTRQVRAMVEE